MAGHQKNKYPLAIHGAYDTFSGYVLYLKVWTSNNDPRVIGKFYLDYIYEKKSELIWFFLVIRVGVVFDISPKMPEKSIRKNLLNKSLEIMLQYLSKFGVRWMTLESSYLKWFSTCRKQIWFHYVSSGIVSLLVGPLIVFSYRDFPGDIMINAVEMVIANTYSYASLHSCWWWNWDWCDGYHALVSTFSA